MNTPRQLVAMVAAFALVILIGLGVKLGPAWYEKRKAVQAEQIRIFEEQQKIEAEKRRLADELQKKVNTTNALCNKWLDKLKSQTNDDGLFIDYTGETEEDVWGHNIVIFYEKDKAEEKVTVRSLGADGISHTGDDITASDTKSKGSIGKWVGRNLRGVWQGAKGE